jgi:hypothetical protein
MINDIPVTQIYHHQDRSVLVDETTLTAANGEGRGRRFVKRTMERIPMPLLLMRIAASLRCGLNQSFDLENSEVGLVFFVVDAIELDES